MNEKAAPRFGLVDDATGVVVGTCADIAGLTGDEVVAFEGEMCQRIFVVGFVPVDATRLPGKERIGLFHVAILAETGEVIGSYNFICKGQIRWQDVNARDRVELVGLLEVLSRQELELWDLWRRPPLPGTLVAGEPEPVLVADLRSQTFSSILSPASARTWP
jgi:hypothetical protein